MTEKKFKQVCRCEHCGSEAEMVITCSLEPVEDEPIKAEVAPEKKAAAGSGKTKGHGVCSHCGNESEIWLDI
jgi:hypothetical protein